MNKIIQSLLEAQNALTSSFSNLKAKQSKPIVNLNQKQQGIIRNIIIIINSNIKNINNNKAKRNNLRSNLKKIRVPIRKKNRKKIILVKMNLTHYMFEIYLTILIKVTYLNYLGYAQQTISVTTLMFKYHFLKILGNESTLLM